MSAPLSFARVPYAWLAVLGLLWGANFPLMKAALSALEPSQAVWLRLAFGAAALAPFLAPALAAVRRRPALLGHSCVMALSANVLTFHCFMQGTRLLDAGTAGVLSGCVPLLTALLAALALPRERLPRAALAGLCVSFLGLVCVLAPWNGAARGSLAGAGYMLAGACGYAVAFVYARRFLVRPGASALSLAALQMLLATLFYAPLARWEGMARVTDSWELLACVAVGLGAVGSGAAYVVYYGLIGAVGAVRASAVSYLPPVAALFMGWAFLGETPGLARLAGAALVLGGIWTLRRN
ncbi:putative cystine transporter YijE [Fundidesulfovibrio magnetotacticus]|uniref:Putative cystine transporter YijE n=1 Tax=Fundidesulfovibrio magnetotacticus TaxID=2730080 RepID=A0A6V8LK19_9BACT|nr:DMT family transporter [Fundidesulfovibrio magnetotacticus]GFK93072.1 putative cystine transporter YijE [Fundidesulfovibrio magnetotacticus]